jgi:hypothetical protein
MAIAPAPSVIDVVELVAARAEAGYQIGRVLGIRRPRPTAAPITGWVWCRPSRTSSCPTWC